MIKNRLFLTILITLVFNFFIHNVSFAQEASSAKYPDYACEFTGFDKCEKFNRKLFVFNLKLNKFVLRPINTLWGSIMPQYAMDRFQNLYTNINFPVRVFSCMFEKDFKSSGKEFERFLINTTVGIGGLYDPATSKFKIEARNEDIEQVLGRTRMPQGPYLVLPVVQGNLRDLFGQLLDIPLRGSSYIPFATTAFFINSSTGAQAGIKRLDESNADPYEVARQLKGLDEYTKIHDLDRKSVFDEKEKSLNMISINNSIADTELKNLVQTKVKADVNLENYNPQGPLIDSMRSALFDNEKVDSSIWSETSVWNRTFKKKLKFSSVNIEKTKPNYKYRYILQKDKKAPLAIIYPAFGEGVWGDKAVRQAKILYDTGYSVIIQSSAFHWEFVRSLPDGYRPGIPSQDAKMLRLTTAKIINDVETKKKCKFEKRILIGNSFGALTTLFVASQEEKENTLGISNYFVINPPIDTFFALKQLDKYSQDWKNNPEDLKLRIAMTAQKIIKVSQNKDYKKGNYENLSLPFNNDEAELVIGYVMKQKLYDVVYTIENCKRSKVNPMYGEMNEMSFYEYSQKYLKDYFVANNGKTLEQLDYDASMHCLADFLQKNKNYKIYHALDDYFTTPEQISWLKSQGKDKVVVFSNGSHLGFLYRPEFIELFKKDIKLQSNFTEL